MYKAIDGNVFYSKSEMGNHNADCMNELEIIMQLHETIPQLYTISFLKDELADYKRNKSSWKTKGIHVSLNYDAHVWALEQAIKILKNRETEIASCIG